MLKEIGWYNSYWLCVCMMCGVSQRRTAYTGNPFAAHRNLIDLPSLHLQLNGWLGGECGKTTRRQWIAVTSDGLAKTIINFSSCNTANLSHTAYNF